MPASAFTAVKILTGSAAVSTKQNQSLLGHTAVVYPNDTIITYRYSSAQQSLYTSDNTYYYRIPGIAQASTVIVVYVD